MKTSIIIPVLNRWDLLETCWATIQAKTPTCEIVVVANGQPHSDLATVVLARNRGFAVACNIGAQYASGDALVFLNDDTEVHEGWLEPLLEHLTKPNVGAVGAKLLYPDGSIQHSGVSVDMANYGREAVNWKHEWAGGSVDAVTGACLAIHRHTFLDVGGFDVGFWNGYEDVDLCLRLRKRGMFVVYEPRSVVTHLESQSGPERWTRVKANIDRLQQKWGDR